MHGDDAEEEFHFSNLQSLAHYWAEEAMRLQKRVDELEGQLRRQLHPATERKKEMNGNQKKWMAILGTVGVALAMGLLQALPNNHAVHVACELAMTVLGALGFTFPVSIKNPDAPALGQSAVEKAQSDK